MPDLADLPPLLLPAPRRMELTGTTAVVSDPIEVGTHVIVLPGNEAYHLAITADGIRWAWRSAQGQRHAAATLAQLRAQYGDRLPCLVIDDAPVFAVRGVMLDISRDRVPTMAHLFETVDRLVSWKINHLQLYTEHTFAYAGHEEVWANASPMTPEEVRQLDVYCRERGIELAANQNCFGHLSSWLKHPRYASLGEIAPDGSWDFNGLVTRQGGFSLCPSDPRSLALIEDLLGQLLPNFTSPLVNIGCDETFDVGQGRSKDEVAKRGRAAVYLDFVAKVCGVARRHAKRPQFWADIALEHPEALGALPDDLIGLAWGYEPDAPFAKWCDQLRSAGREAWVCPGTSCWRSITGRTTERRGNLLAAARDGASHGATGYLITAWGDLGHRQQWPITLHALAEGAHRAWSGEAPYNSDASGLHAFGDRTGKLGQWIDSFGDLDAELRSTTGRLTIDGLRLPLRNASAIFTDQTKLRAELWLGSEQDWSKLRVTPYLQSLANVENGTGVSQRVMRELRVSMGEVGLSLSRAAQRRSTTLMSNRAKIEQRQGWLLQRDVHRETWLARSRPGGLDDSCRHYQRLIDELESG